MSGDWITARVQCFAQITCARLYCGLPLGAEVV
jgi:hypothetical protein